MDELPPVVCAKGRVGPVVQEETHRAQVAAHDGHAQRGVLRAYAVDGLATVDGRAGAE